MYWSDKHSNPTPSMGRRINPEPAGKKDNRASGKPDRPAFSLNPALKITALLIVLIGTAVFFSNSYQSGKTINNVTITGNFFTEPDEVIQAASLPMGLSPDSVSFLEAIRQVETLAYVQHASMRVQSGGTVVVHVRERRPLGMFISGNRRAYVDSDGVIMPVRPGRAVDVPLVYGIGWTAGQDTLQSASFLKVRDFLQAAQNEPLALATLSEIVWTQEEGIVALSHENGIRLVFGNDRFGEALANWDLFYRSVVSARGPESFNQVDLRYRGQIVTRES